MLVLRNLKKIYDILNLYLFSTTNDDILKDWAEIRSTATEVLGVNAVPPARARVTLAGKKLINIINSILHWDKGLLF